MPVALGKEDRERERNEDEGNVEKWVRGGGSIYYVSFLSPCLLFMNIPEQGILC